VGVHVADIPRLAVESGIVASWAAPKTLTVSAVEAVVMRFIAHLIKSLTHLVFSTNILLALVGVQVTLVVRWAVLVVI